MRQNRVLEIFRKGDIIGGIGPNVSSAGRFVDYIPPNESQLPFGYTKTSLGQQSTPFPDSGNTEPAFLSILPLLFVGRYSTGSSRAEIQCLSRNNPLLRAFAITQLRGKRDIAGKPGSMHQQERDPLVRRFLCLHAVSCTASSSLYPNSR